MLHQFASQCLCVCMPGGVVGEHLKWEGKVVQEWLLRVTNAVVDLKPVF